MVIYADILLAVNWWVDFLLLLLVRRVTGAGVAGWRVALGGLVGALSCVLIVLPPMPVLLTLAAKLAAAAAMVVTAFGFERWRVFVRRLLWLFALSAGLSGLCAALYFYVAPRGFYVFNGTVYYAVPPLLLVGLTVVCYALLWVWERLLRHRAAADTDYTVTVTHGGRQVRMHCLYDSGNHLTEPFSGYPVLVAERYVVARLLTVPQSLSEISSQEAVWRVVPFDSIGGEGALPAFLPQRITVHTPDGERVLPRCYVAVCDRLGRGGYDALLGSAVGDYLT